MLETPITPRAEARRQIEICNACRYCEGYCAVFPAMFRERAFADGDITQLANLCHNCRGCYYACQYTPPHAFAINLPAALAAVQAESWERFSWPSAFARLFHKDAAAISALLATCIAALFGAVAVFQPEDGEGFYAHLSHAVMVAIFLPLFLAPFVVITMGLHRYWREVGGERVRIHHLTAAFSGAARLKNLSGGHGKGCNFEGRDRFSNKRRIAHQAVMYGYLLCFAATVSATVLHYVFSAPAPYGLWSVPKLFGIPGGIALSAGAAAMAWLKIKADRELSLRRAWGAEMAFIVVIGLAGFTGLVLFAAKDTALVPPLLAIHLGVVGTSFLMMPYSKMAHAFYRLAALVREAQIAPRA